MSREHPEVKDDRTQMDYNLHLLQRIDGEQPLPLSLDFNRCGGGRRINNRNTEEN